MIDEFKIPQAKTNIFMYIIYKNRNIFVSSKFVEFLNVDHLFLLKYLFKSLKHINTYFIEYIFIIKKS